MTPDSPRIFGRLRDYIREQCGIEIGPEKTYLIESRLAKLLVSTGCPDFEQFYLKARSDESGELRDRIVDAMATNETQWFRDERLWDALREAILPEYMHALNRSGRGRLRIWSAACSTGQEPYSLVMLLDELLSDPALSLTRPADIEILGSDISEAALRIAVAGRYNQLAMSRGLSEARRARYFEEGKGVWELRKEWRSRVRYEKRNLQKDFGSLGPFDLVLMRNVTIYFAEPFKRELFARVARVLAPGGCLVLGSAESLSGYSSEFEMKEYKRALYYPVKR